MVVTESSGDVLDLVMLPDLSQYASASWSPTMSAPSNACAVRSMS
ncbi:MAG TPA: hypothetical protein VGN22_06210 [Pseudonocardia sp.]